MSTRSAMSKLPSTITFLLTFYVLPLAARPELLLTWPVLLLAAFCTVLFLTQPALSVQESKAHKGTDGWTIWLIIGVSGAGQILSLVDWAYRQGAPDTLDAWTGCGILLLTVGTAFRLWAIRTLRNNFAATVQIKPGQQLITSGPYRWLRHPSYTGTLLTVFGTVLALASAVGMGATIALVLPAYLYRISVEERTMVAGLGEAYASYRKRTPALFPWPSR